MPIYEYRCRGCETTIEAIQSFSAPALTICQECGGDLKKLISRSAFHLKGSGWYSDHYGLKSGDSGKKEAALAGANADSSPAASTDNGAKKAAEPEVKKSADPEAKPATAAEAKKSTESAAKPAAAPEAKPASDPKVPSAAA